MQPLSATCVKRATWIIITDNLFYHITKWSPKFDLFSSSNNYCVFVNSWSVALSLFYRQFLPFVSQNNECACKILHVFTHFGLVRHLVLVLIVRSVITITLESPAIWFPKYQKFPEWKLDKNVLQHCQSHSWVVEETRISQWEEPYVFFRNWLFVWIKR